MSRLSVRGDFSALVWQYHLGQIKHNLVHQKPIVLKQTVSHNLFLQLILHI